MASSKTTRNLIKALLGDNTTRKIGQFWLVDTENNGVSVFHESNMPNYEKAKVLSSQEEDPEKRKVIWNNYQRLRDKKEVELIDSGWKPKLIAENKDLSSITDDELQFIE